MNVRDLMTSPIPSVPPDASIAQVAQLVLDRNVPGVPVVDSSGRLLGTVTEKDLVAKHARLHMPVYLSLLGGFLPLETHRTDEEVRHILAVSARDIMSGRPDTIPAGADVDDAATMMVEKDADLLVVVDGEMPAGVITRRDIIRLLVVEENDGNPAS